MENSGGIWSRTELTNPHLQHLILSCEILCLSLVERALVPAVGATEEPLSAFAVVGCRTQRRTTGAAAITGLSVATVA